MLESEIDGLLESVVRPEAARNLMAESLAALREAAGRIIVGGADSVVGLDAPPAFAAVSDLAFKFLIEASEGDDRRPPAPSPAPAEPAVPLDDLDAVQLLTWKTPPQLQKFPPPVPPAP
jgi:hypothetical protein